MDDLKIFIPLQKIDEEKRLVYGCIAAEVEDKSREIMDYASAKPAFEAWSADIAKTTNGKSLGNVRAMHGSVAAGKIDSISFDDEGKSIQACAKIVDDGEWKKVLEGVYSGFSMGGRYLKRWADPDQPHLTRYTPSVSEVSIVDNPCIGCATFEVVKADGSTEMRKFKTAEPDPAAPTNVAPDVEQGWKAKDGTFHATKAAALKHNTDVDADALAKAAAGPVNDALAKLDAALAPKPESVALPAEAAIVEAQPQPKADKATRIANLSKSLYDVARLANILDDLKWMQSSLKSEAAWEGDNSPAPDLLLGMIESLGKFLVALATEETGELTKPEGAEDAEGDYAGDEYVILEMAAKAIGVSRTEAIAKALPAGALKRALEKAGARHSKVDQKRVQDMHDTSVDLGAMCDGKPTADGQENADKAVTGDLAKVVSENAALKSTLDSIVPKIDAAIAKIAEQGAEIDRLNAQPLPGGPVVNGARTVLKGQETGADSDPMTALKNHLATLPADQRALAMMKLSLAQPSGTIPEPLGKRA